MTRIDQILSQGPFTLAGDDCGKVAIFNADPAATYPGIDPAAARVIQPLAPDAQQLGNRWPRVLPQATPEIDGLSAAIVHAQRSRAATLGDIARALHALRPGGTLLVDGDRGNGIDGLRKRLLQMLPEVASESKAHGRVLRLRRPDSLSPEQAAALSSWAQAAAPHAVPGGFQTCAGIFSEDGPDPASQALAQACAADMSGKVADLGAGWGYLAHAALQAGAGRVELFEADWRAVQLARTNLAPLDPEGTRAGYHWCDVTALPPDATFDRVICNPPFHASRKADPALGQAFLRVAASLLTSGGALWLVANRQLPYESTLEQSFAQVERVAQDARFKLFRAARPLTRMATRRAQEHVHRPARGGKHRRG